MLRHLRASARRMLGGQVLYARAHLGGRQILWGSSVGGGLPEADGRPVGGGFPTLGGPEIPSRPDRTSEGRAAGRRLSTSSPPMCPKIPGNHGWTRPRNRGLTTPTCFGQARPFGSRARLRHGKPRRPMGIRVDVGDEWSSRPPSSLARSASAHPRAMESHWPAKPRGCLSRRTMGLKAQVAANGLSHR
jgi:hypothetical protein